MPKPTYRDLTLIIILSIASLTFLTIPALDQNLLSIIPPLLILLFLPGYALMAVIDPLFNQRSAVKMVISSFTVSLLLTISLIIISAHIKIDVSIYILLVVLTIVLSILAFFRRRMSLGRPRPLPREEKLRPDEVEVTEKSVKTGELKGVSKETQKVETEKEETPTPERKFFSVDLLLVIILTVLCALFVLEPALNKTVVRTVLGLLLVLFLPGYALIASLFPKRDDLDTIERLALSFGLSIAITPLIGLALNYTPYGIRLDPILISLTGATLLLSLVAFLRRRRIPDENRFRVDFGGFFGGVRDGFQGESKTGKILSVILVLSIILAISTTAYIIVKPKVGESFTEFYILGPDGKASDYPTNLTPNQEGRLIIGVVNHENRETSYRLLVTSNSTVQMEQTVTLKDGQKIEIPFNFTAGEPGERKIEFLLFKLPDNNNIYRSLHLWLNITLSASETSE